MRTKVNQPQDVTNEIAPVLALDVERIRRDFPIFRLHQGERRLVYLDSAATSQKPRQVLEAVRDFYERSNANPHRGVYALAQEATRRLEGARRRLARFFGVEDPHRLIFVRNATEGINLVARAWGERNLGPGDVVLVTEMEHHSNLVPWHLLAKRTGAVIEAIPITDMGMLAEEEFHRLLEKRPKLVAVTHVSNVLGTVNPVREIVEAAHRVGARVLVDGAQSAPHMPVDVDGMGCDFYAFSGHKMLGPTGSGGIIVGNYAVFEEMDPFLGGGDMIREVFLDRSEYADPPWRYEAGTQDAAGVVGLSAAADYLDAVGRESIAMHVLDLGRRARDAFEAIPGVRVLGPQPGGLATGSVLSFVVEDIHPHDLAQFLDTRGVAIRAGHHCAQPLMRRFGLAAAARASFYLYNTIEEVDLLAGAVEDARKDIRRTVVAAPPARPASRDEDRDGLPGSGVVEEPQDELLREIVLDHYMHPDGTEPVQRVDAEWHGKNPLCGDEVTVRLQLRRDRVQGIQVTGHGCTISVASGSILASMVKGKTLREAQRLLGALRAILHGEPPPRDLELGDMAALRGLKDLPVRVKCAMLPWTTFEEALRARNVGAEWSQ